MAQFRRDRDPREPLLKHRRCVAHFAVDPNLVCVTTQLAGEETRFLPFNRGHERGAGNPPVPPTRRGYPTSYLWNQVWARDSVLDLIRQFVHQEKMNRYQAVIEKVFFDHFTEGTTEFGFDREELEDAVSVLGFARIKNLGDITWAPR